MKVDKLVKKICFALVGAGSGLVIAACYGAYMNTERPPVRPAESGARATHGERRTGGGAQQVAGGEESSQDNDKAWIHTKENDEPERVDDPSQNVD